MGLRDAIKRQEALVAASPNDVKLLQKLGELHQKAGDTDAAADLFGRAATAYGRDGFFLKAVALMKQCLRLNPKLVTERESLAGWYVGLSLNAEASAEYRMVLNHYQSIQAAEPALRVMELLAQLGARPN